MGRENNKLLKLKNSPVFWLFLSVSLLFGILFFRFIFGSYAYVYEDIGSDTFHINYPLYMLFSDFLHEGGYQDYVLRAGLGMDISSYLFQYILNPLNLLVIALPQKYLSWAVLLATYCKLLLLAFSAYGLFRRWLSHDWAGMLAALFWTFSGYVMLWGQHYGFCMSMALFTTFMLLAYLYTEERETSRNWLLVLWITLMLITNYYFLYTSGVIGAAFVLLYLWWKKEHPLRILKKLIGLALMGISGICIGGICLIPTINTFFNSARVESVVNTFSRMFTPYPLRSWLTYLGRFLSNNTFGVGNDYYATLNYYEAIILTVSALALPAIIYLLLKKETRLRTAFLTVLCLLMMGFRITGQLLNFSLLSYRWSFFICFLEAFAIGYFIRERIEGADIRRIRTSLCIAAVLIGLALIALAVGSAHYHFQLAPAYLVIYVVFFVLYAIWFAWKNDWLPTHRKAASYLILGVTIVELAVVNFPTINFRMALTRYQVNEERYNDGTGDAWEVLSEEDPSVYRVGRNDEAYVNDSMAQGYPGFSVYMTTNSKEAVDFKESFGGIGIGANKVVFEESNTTMRALLGLKYLIADPSVSLPSADYTYVRSVGDKDIYEYDSALPFGYLYDRKWSRKTIRKMKDPARISAIVNGFYFTEGSSDTSYEKAEAVEEEQSSILEYVKENFHCDIEETDEGVRFYNFEQNPYDPYVVWHDLDNALDDGTLHEIYIKTDPEKLKSSVRMTIYYATCGDEDYRYERMKDFTFSKDAGTFHMFLPAGTTDIRIDVESKASEMLLTELYITNYPGLEIPYQKLRESTVTDATFAENTYHATVDNTQDATRMLCVPLLYGKGWTALLDETETTLYNINDGLCGIEIPPGSHQVTLRYTVPHKALGYALTLAGIFIYLIAFLLHFVNSYFTFLS